MRCAWGLGLAFCLFLLGCGGGGGGSTAPAGPVTPGAIQLQASYDPWQSQIKLSWTPLPLDANDGFIVEAKIGSGTFTKLNQVPLYNGMSSVLLVFTSLPPELAVVDFRMYGVKNGVNGPTSNVAEIQIPVIPPTSFSAAYAAQEGGIRVGWGCASAIADRFVLERATCDAGGTLTSGWVSLALPSPMATSYLDAQVAESQGYRYRVTAWAGGNPSPTAGPGLRVAPPPLAPTGFAAQPLVGAVGLSWTNQSRTATQIRVLRTSPGVPGEVLLATLPPTATGYQDAGLSLGYYSYALSVTDGQASTAIPALLAAPANPPGAPVLTATPQYSSIYMSASALGPGGQWAFGMRTPLTVFSALGSPWPSWTPATWYDAPAAFLQLDAQSRPHALYQTQTATTNVLMHAWFDGSAWTSEVVQSRAAAGAYLPSAYGLDASGGLQVLHDAGPGGTIQSLVYSRKVAGAWVHEALQPTGTALTYQGTPRLSLDLAGNPHALVATWTDTRSYARNADGTWTGQVLPNALPWTNGYFFQDGAWSEAGTAWVFYENPDPANLSNDGFWVMRQVAGTWQPPQLLASFPHPGSALASVALSPDGTRIAAVCRKTNGLCLYTPTAQGWMETLLPIPPGDYAHLKAAFDGANRLHILVKTSFYTQDLVDLHE